MESLTSVLTGADSMTADLNQSDPELLRQALTGREEQFTLLYQQRQGGVYRFALQMSGSATLAEDITQETFIALLKTVTAMTARWALLQRSSTASRATWSCAAWSATGAINLNKKTAPPTATCWKT